MTKFNAKLLSPEAIAITRREPLTPTNHGVFMDPFFFKHSSLERLFRRKWKLHSIFVRIQLEERDFE